MLWAVDEPIEILKLIKICSMAKANSFNFHKKIANISSLMYFSLFKTLFWPKRPYINIKLFINTLSVNFGESHRLLGRKTLLYI